MRNTVLPVLMSAISMTALVVGTAAPAMAQEAPAIGGSVKEQEEGDAAGGEIVVTGTLIKGVAPVGAPTIPFTRDDMLRTGAQSTADIIATIPQVASLGGNQFTANAGQSQQGSRINAVGGRATNLRGLGPAATLVLIDGRRPATGNNSAGQTFFDIDSIPSIAIQRVEVVADGASAIYGSDAVAGVVNFILRKRFDGVEVNGQHNFTDSIHSSKIGGIIGKTWSNGGVMLAGEYLDGTALKAADTGNLFSDDLRPYGLGSPPRLSYPGNIVAGSTFYPIPAGQDGSNLLLSQLSAGSPNLLSYFDGAEVSPNFKRWSVVGSGYQELGDSIRVELTGHYSKRTFDQARANTVSAANGLSVPASNPFSPCNPARNLAGNPGLNCAANLSVLYAFTNDLGHEAFTGFQENFGGTASLGADLGGSWNLDLSAGYYQNDDYARTGNLINSNAVSRALGNTVASIAKPADVPFFNPFCGNATSCNSAQTLDYIRAWTDTYSRLKRYQAKVQANGSLFTLGAGDVKLAIGAEYRNDKLFARTGATTNTPSVLQPAYASGTMEREVKSVYGELLVPIVGDEGSVLRKVNLSLAGRIEDYSDFGTTKNPKIGLDWEPIDGLKFHGSFGTSFRAPSLADIADTFGNRTTPNNVVGTQLGLATSSTLSVINRGGGGPGLVPEKATTWSLGFDISPRLAPGLTASVNYFNIKYENIITNPPLVVGLAGAINATPLYDRYITYNPLYFPTRATMSQSDFNAFVNGLLTATYPPVTAAAPAIGNVAAVVDGRTKNAARVDAQGLDFSLRYAQPADWGEWRVGASGTYVLSWKVSPVVGAPSVEQVNNFSYPLRFVARAEAGATIENFDVSFFANYRNSYNIGRIFLPVGAAAQYESISSYLTVDANFGYKFEKIGFLKDAGISLSVQNLFQRKPPLVLNGGVNAIQFDPANASPFGRTVSVSLRAGF